MELAQLLQNLRRKGFVHALKRYNKYICLFILIIKSEGVLKKNQIGLDQPKRSQSQG